MIERTSNIEVRKVNRNRIFRLLYRADKLSNQAIATRLKMSLPTVSQNIKELMEQGIIEEDGTFESTGGRKAKALSYNRAARFSVGLNITKNNVVIVVIDLSGKAINYNHYIMRFNKTEEYFSKIGELVCMAIDDSKVDKSKILGVGIALPSIVSKDKQSVLYDYILGIRGESCSRFSKYIPYPCILCNDANAGGFAEMWNYEEVNNVYYLSLSSSVGGSLFIDNKLYYGEHQRCSEVGHMTIFPGGRQCYCGKYGCADTYCNTTILSNSCNGSLSEFFDKLRDGAPVQTEIWNEYLKYLAITINNLRMLFDCNVILGGYLGSYMDEHIDTLRSLIAQRDSIVADGAYLQVCRYKFEAAAVGAALMHIDSFISSI